MTTPVPTPDVEATATAQTAFVQTAIAQTAVAMQAVEQTATAQSLATVTAVAIESEQATATTQAVEASATAQAAIIQTAVAQGLAQATQATATAQVAITQTAVASQAAAATATAQVVASQRASANATAEAAAGATQTVVAMLDSTADPVSRGLITISNATINNQGKFATLSPGQSFTLSYDFLIKDPGCPGCRDQVLIGIMPGSQSISCDYSDVPGAQGVSQHSDTSMTAPSLPGMYYISFTHGQDRSCNTGWWNVSGPPAESAAIARIEVR
jgi:hypothetical protein